MKGLCTKINVKKLFLVQFDRPREEKVSRVRHSTVTVVNSWLCFSKVRRGGSKCGVFTNPTARSVLVVGGVFAWDSPKHMCLTGQSLHVTSTERRQWNHVLYKHVFHGKTPVAYTAHCVYLTWSNQLITLNQCTSACVIQSRPHSVPSRCALPPPYTANTEAITR